MPTLRIEQKHEKPFDTELSKDSFTIGRSSNNDLSFSNLSLSRHHAKLIRKDEHYYLEDMESRNGTFLNGIRVRHSSSLNNKDVIQLGEITLHFVDPLLQDVELTDTRPVLAIGDTFLIDTGKLMMLAEEAISSISPVPEGEEYFWPALNQAATTLITNYPLGKLEEVIMDIVFQAVPAERGALIMLNPEIPEGLNLKVVRNAHENQNLQISRTIVNEVVKNQKAVLTLDAQTDGRFESSESIQMQGIRSIICVPLWNERKVIGLIYVDNLVSHRSFTPSDLRLLALIGNMAAIKIENVLLLEEQLEKKRMDEQLAVAAQIQRRLLPQFNPEIPNYEIYGINHSCYEIGGDYYDFITKDNGKIAIVIAGVTGRGVGAAMLMAGFQASLRALSTENKEPAELIALLNIVLMENSPANKYITLFYAELDSINHTLEYVNAGHEPPLLVTQDACTLLSACGPVVGIIPNAQYVSKQISLEPRDLVFFYTDGITKIRNLHEEEFGEERVVSFLMNNRNAGVKELSDLLENTIHDFAQGAPLLDDSTLIILRRLQ